MCVEHLVVTAAVRIVQCYCVVWFDFIVVTASVGIEKWNCVVCVVYCG